MLVVGLTGGIASGKSTAADLFAKLGVPILDADVIAREVVEPDSPGLAAVAAAFGRQVLTADGRLDRAALRERVFADPAERQRLEALLHPLIRARLQQRLAALSAPYAVLVAPLLLEAGMADLVDRILVVDLPEEAQIQRVMRRDSSSRAQAENILASQYSRRRRLERADDVISNTGEPAELEPQVLKLHRLYLQLAAGQGQR